jgi:hypothetical protein
METSRILARIIGPLLIIPALGVFLNLDSYQRLIEEFSKSVGYATWEGLWRWCWG